jgi:aspartoacylase
MDQIKTVAVCGGTHGNELNGIALIKRWQDNPQQIQYDTLDVELVLSNPKANSINRRYVDQDLNRQFSLKDLNDETLTGYEQQRGKALNAQLGPKGDNPRVDFVIDLHTTTANMGMSLIFNSLNPVTAGMAVYVQQKHPEAKLFFEDLEPEEDNFLVSVGKVPGFLVEIGPVPQGVLRADIFEQTRLVTQYALEYLELHNKGELPDLSGEYVAYEFVEKVDLPKDAAGEINGMIHAERQDQDYHAISKGDPLFMLFDGTTVAYEGDETLYGCFINEAAYYDRQVGLSLMRKTTIVL